MLHRLVLCAAVLCALLTVRGAAQPARCRATFQIDSTQPVIIVPDVDNCFGCPPQMPDWTLDDDGAQIPITTVSVSIANGQTTAVVEGGYLVIPMPQLYVLPGNRGRRDIVCMDPVSGALYQTRLTSPVLTTPRFNNLTVREGSTLSLTCSNTAAVGISRLEIVAPNGSVVGSNNFKVQNATRILAGTYTCIVSSVIVNNTDQIAVTAEVVIEYAPEVTPANSTAMMHEVSLGSELRLTCNYTSVPSAVVIWIHNDTMSLMDGSEGVTILGGAPGDTMFTIVISSVDRDSGGTYTCNTTNTVGSDAATYDVLILIPPAPVTNLNVTNIDEREATLTWMTGFDGFTAITDVVADVLPERGNNIMANLSLGNDGMERITGLMPFRNHTFSVAVVNMVGLSDRRTISAFTLSLRLEAPTNIMFVSESSTNIRLTWDPPMFDEDTTGEPLFYIVGIMRSDGSVSNTTNITDPNERVVNFQNLAKGVDYQATITAYNVRGRGATSEMVMNQTLVDPPSMPQNVNVKGVGAEVLRVTWEAPEDNGGRPVTVYRVVVTNVIPPFIMDVSVAMDTSLLIRNVGLMENTTYTVAVSASNVQGFGMNATEMGRTQSIEEPQTIFDEPTSDIIASTNSTAVLSWEFPGGTVDNYLVQYVLSRSDFETGMVVNRTVSGNETSVVVDNLLPGSTYQFRVAVVNNLGISEFGPAGIFETLIPNPPIITTSPPNPVPTGATVTLNCTSTLEGAVYSWKRGNTDLTNNNQYEIGPNYLRIRAVDASFVSIYKCTASADNGNIRVTSEFLLEVLPITPSEEPTIDQTVIIIVAVVGGVALLIFIVVVVIAVCCLCGMRKKSSSGSYPMKKLSKPKKEPQNANWIETSTHYVPATGNQPPADSVNPSDRLAFDYSVDLQTHSSFNTLEKNAVHSTANPAPPTHPIGVHAPVAPGSQYEVGSPAFEYVPSEMPVTNGNEPSGELPTYVNTTTVV